MRNLSTKQQAKADQIIAVLRDENGFPLSTGAIAKKLGGRWVTFSERPPLRPRPSCWPEHFEDDGLSGAWCQACGVFHQQPIWRLLEANDIRSLLNRLAREGEIEKVVLDTTRRHYWRREDTDREARKAE